MCEKGLYFRNTSSNLNFVFLLKSIFYFRNDTYLGEQLLSEI